MRKIELKKQFDNVYDDGSGNADSTYYDELKKEVDSQVLVYILSDNMIEAKPK